MRKEGKIDPRHFPSNRWKLIRRRRRRKGLREYKDGPEERRFKRIAGPCPVGDISFLHDQEGIVLLPYQIPSFLRLDSSPRDRTITSFLFSFNYRCQGVITVRPPGSSSRCSAHFFPFLTYLHYSFIYSNYLHDVNLSLPLISCSHPSLCPSTRRKCFLKSHRISMQISVGVFDRTPCNEFDFVLFYAFITVLLIYYIFINRSMSDSISINVC